MSAEHAARGVGRGVGDEGADQNVDQQPGPVVGQVTQQHRVDQRDPDPDDAQQGYPDRDGRAVALLRVGGEEEEQREGRGEDQEHVEGGAEMRGEDQRRHGEVRGDRKRPRSPRSSSGTRAGRAPRRRSSPPRRGCRRRPRSRSRHDPGQHHQDPLDRLAAGAAPPARLSRGSLRRPRLGLVLEHLLEEVDGHVLAPKRRCRFSYSRNALSKAARSKSGQSSSRKTSSE